MGESNLPSVSRPMKPSAVLFPSSSPTPTILDGWPWSRSYRYNRTQSQDIASQGGCACIWWIYLRVARAFCSFWVCWNLEPNDKRHPSWHRWAHRRKSLRRYASLDPEAPKHRSTQGKRPHLRTTGGQPMPKGLTQCSRGRDLPIYFLQESRCSWV